MNHKSALFAATAMLAAMPASALAAPVLLVSIDGLRADDITKADARGLEVPTLRALAAGGAHASSVRGVLPTITYPSHTTMITGVHPARHGITGNVAFDPKGTNAGGWMWYAQDIKVPTLWDTVKAKGGKVASIGWPVSVGKPEIDYNVPEFWRTKTPEDEKLLRAVSTVGMPDEIAAQTGVPFAQVALDRDEVHRGMDEARFAWAPAIIARYKPQLTTVHIVGLDGARHTYGPASPEARDTLKRIDTGLAEMIAKARAAQPDLVVAVVSDHGFLPTENGLNLIAAFATDGLVTLGPDGKVSEWKAIPWISGGSAAIILKDPADKATEAKVQKLLSQLSANPANGIEMVLDRATIASQGGTKDAAFWVSMKSGFSVSGDTSPPLVRPIHGRGTHGYSPATPDMLSVFLVNGPGIARRDLGAIDMRDIGPTLGQILDAPLPNPEGKALKVTTGQ